MAIISEFEEEQQPTPPSSSAGINGADEEALLRILNRKGPIPFFETVVDLLSRRSDLFKTEQSVSKLTAVLSAARQKEVVKQTALNKKAEKEPLSENLASIAKNEIKEKVIEKMDVDESNENTSKKPVEVNVGGGKQADTIIKPNTGNGLDLEKYSWTQTLKEVNVNIKVPRGTKSRFVICEIKKNHLKVGLKGQPAIIDGDLFQSVKVDDCYWSIEDQEVISILLTKQNQMEWWKCVTKGEPEIDTQKVEPENSKLSDLDPETRQTVEKMMMGKQKEDGAPASWAIGTTLLYCDFCIKEIELGNRPTSHFNKDGWNNIMNNFNERTGRTYDRTQLKNKWDHLKKEWKLWKELLRGETGIGWDPIKKTIDASPEWWNEKIQVIPAAKKFRYNGIVPELEEKLDRMFGQIVATGDNVWVPNSGVLSVELTNAGEGTSRPISQKSQTSIPITSRKRKMKSCKSGGRQLLINHINELVNAARSISFSIATANADRKTFTIPEALHEVAQISYIFNDEEFYDFAIDFLQDKNRRETFMSIPADRKVWWLRRHFFRSSL